MDRKSRYAFCFLILFLLFSTCVSYGEDSNGQRRDPKNWTNSLVSIIMVVPGRT